MLPSHVIYDPTGNVTALVEDSFDVADQPAVAYAIQQAHPEVEQVGFVHEPRYDEAPADVTLRMAGGEFCGNATMCAAVWWARRRGGDDVLVHASGAPEPVRVSVRHEGDGSYACSVRMPYALSFDDVELTHMDMSGILPLVRLEGISHLVVAPGSGFFDLLCRCGEAEHAVRRWCAELGTDGLGLMFLDGSGPTRRLIPLVYVPGAGTCFWERSCASGSASVGMWLAHDEGAAIDVDLVQPGGTLHVTCDPTARQAWLSGHVRV